MNINIVYYFGSKIGPVLHSINLDLFPILHSNPTHILIELIPIGCHFQYGIQAEIDFCLIIFNDGGDSTLNQNFP